MLPCSSMQFPSGTNDVELFYYIVQGVYIASAQYKG